MNPGTDTRIPGGRVSRRRLLGWGASLSAGAIGLPLLAGCTGSGEPVEKGANPNDKDAGPITINWWDHFRPLTALFEDELFKPYHDDHPNVTVKRRQMVGPDLGQALQLARRSEQMPDVHSNAGLQTAAGALVGSDWFQPIDDVIDIEKTPLKDHIYDGIHRFDGKVYTLPMFSSLFHLMTSWTNTELLKKADVDPTNGPRTWDDYRATLKTIGKKMPDKVAPIVWPMKEPVYLEGQMVTLAQVAGAPGVMDWRTGQDAVATDPFFEAMEFMIAMQKDGLMHPASPSLGQRDARARFAAGEAALYPWGPWIIGGLMVQEKEAVERGISCWRVPAPEKTPSKIYNGPGGGQFWLSSQSKNPQVAADVMGRMATEEFFKKLAVPMDQPPILQEVVADADVHPAYSQNIEYNAEDMAVSPVPEARNGDVIEVIVEMRDIHPDLGEIAQAVLTGSTKDYKGALREYADKLAAERSRAIKVAVKKGAKVSEDDWKFDSWQPGKDFTQDQYR